MASFGKKTEILKRGLDDVHLDYKLAQQIADKTMDVLGKNINIMDRHGIIIGSGNKIGSILITKAQK